MSSGLIPYKVLTYKDKDLRTAVALEQSRAKNEKEALSSLSELNCEFLESDLDLDSVTDGIDAESLL